MPDVCGAGKLALGMSTCPSCMASTAHMAFDLENLMYPKSNPHRCLLCLVLLGAWQAFGLAHAAGGIATDGTVGGPAALGHPQDLRGSKLTIPEDLGSRAGANLFHSFKDFNVQTGQTVTFTEKTPGSLDNVISRVTGSSASDIDGTLRSTPKGHADFYLINPNGVTFGPKAQVDVPAAFHVSTADEVKFKDGGKFSAVDPAASTLSSAAPAAFGFLGTSKANNGLLKVDGAQLAAKSGQTLDGVAGNIQLENGATLSSDAGEIRLVATQGQGTVSLERTDHDHLPLPEQSLTGTNGGEIAIQQAAITTAGNGGGRIAMWSKHNALKDSVMSADNHGDLDATPAKGIEIRANAMSVDNTAIHFDSLGTGSTSAGTVSIGISDALIMNAAGTISNSSYGTGNSGDVNVKAGQITIDGQGFSSGMTGIFSLAEAGSSGAAGTVSVKSDGTIRILEHGSLASATLGLGNGGNVIISANKLFIDGRENGFYLLPDGALRITGISTGSLGSGNAGNIDIDSGIY